MTETHFPGDITEEELFEEIFETQWMVEEDNFRYLLDGLDTSELQIERRSLVFFHFGSTQPFDFRSGHPKPYVVNSTVIFLLIYQPFKKI